MLLRTILIAAAILAMAAQRGPSQFEVVSVMPNKSGYRTAGIFRFQPDGSLRVVNMPLRDVIRVAYRLHGYQMDGWPGWLSSEYFDIQAKAAGNPNEEQRLSMLRSLLEARFKLAAHRQTRRGSTYELSVVRSDRKSAPVLKPSSTDCDALRAKLPPVLLPPPPNALLIVCGIRNLPGRLLALGVPFDTVATTLAEIVGRPVIDQTKLAGNFDLDVTYTPDPMPAREAIPPDSRPIDPNGPSIFTALREQLGVTLNARQLPFEVLVIDRVERPASD